MKIQKTDNKFTITNNEGTSIEVSKEIMNFIEQVYKDGRDIMSTREASIVLNKSRQWINRMAAQYNIGKIVGKERFYWKEDIEWLKNNVRDPGRPKKGEKITPPSEQFKWERPKHKLKI